ncbi:phosphotransferase [Streptococcus dentapri]|uniref:Phosphotransferase n=2 Tax=Streptococcus dentapri TaxID=573564 RepID=A0ABV8CYL6_9STRE
MNNNFGQGRNIVTKEVNDNNVWFLKKTLSGEQSDRLRRFENLLKWEQIVEALNFSDSPKIVKYNKDDSTIIYEYIKDSKSLQDEISNDRQNELDLITKATKILTKLHQIDYLKYDFKLRYQEGLGKNYLDILKFMDIRNYCYCTGAELEAFSLLQKDLEFLKIVTEIRGTYQPNRLCIVHGDMRLDQFLVDSRNKLWIIDFEEIKIGDIYEDIANLLASILFDCLLKIFSSSELGNDGDINEEIQRLGKLYLPDVKIKLSKIIEIYNNNLEVNINILDLHFYIGLFIIERIISRAKLSFRLSSIDKALMGIGRGIVVNPNILKEFV